MAQRFLRQLKSGTTYHWTPTLAKRGDMVDYDPITAQKRIEALKAQKMASDENPAPPAITPEMLAQSQELTALENEMNAEVEAEETAKNEDIQTKKRVLSDEELEAEAREKTLQEDAQILAINGMKKKNQVEEFLLREFGVELDPENMTLKEMKEEAIRLRTTRLFE